MLGSYKITKNGKRWTSVLLSVCLVTQALVSSEVLCCHAENRGRIQKPQENELYAESAVLMDGESGRILYSKAGEVERPMASTTKVMTCILALECGNLDEYVTASSRAASQPEVRLGVQEGEELLLRDLLYSLMLESHNDAAVMIAEHVGRSEEGFADMMNEKAEQIGCMQTYFITPNGLDREDNQGIHHTTAIELAKIFRYCIMESPEKDLFLDITQTTSYQFSDKEGKHHYVCNNHNALLSMMKGAISGKTGFTGDAGYCYVGAVGSQGRTYIVSLLGCGWPNNKGYKWKDARKLFTYGMQNFHDRNILEEYVNPVIEVKNGIPDDGKWKGKATVMIEPKLSDRKNMFQLVRDDEKIRYVQKIKKSIEAPLKKGSSVGTLRIYAGKEMLDQYTLVSTKSIEKRTLWWEICKILKNIKKND